MCNTSWKESSKSWLETNKFWLNENKTDIEDVNKFTDKDADTRTSGVGEKETYENKKDDDEKGKLAF